MKSIKKWRKKKQMSAEFVARSLEVSRQTVINWEQGRTEPGASDLKKLAQLFGVSADELLKEVKE